MALPAPARGFRAGVLSLLYSGDDQSASSFLEAFCLFRRAPSVPALRLCALRSAPLRVASRRVAPRRAALPFRIFLPAFLVSFAFLVQPIYLSLSPTAASACPMRRQDSAIATRPPVKHGQISRFLHDIVISRTTPPGVEWHATSDSRPVSCQPSRETLNIAFYS